MPLSAQQKYATAELQDIGKLLKRKPINHIERTDSQTMMVTHLGLPMFVSKFDYPYDLIFRFVERFTLYAKLLDPVERKLLLTDNKVNMDVTKVAAMDSTKHFNLTSDENIFHLSWDNCEMTFPKNFQLISGMNKKECEAFFHQQLLAYCESHSDSTADRIPIALPVDSASYVVSKGDYYIIREMNRDQYYLNIGDDKLCPLYGEKYASESVTNLFQKLVSGNFSIKIRQNLYNYKRQDFSLPLSTFINYCKDEGCRTYVGIEEENEKMVKAAVVFRNDLFAYNHLLYVEVNRQILREQKGEMTAILYCYIPTHNLKNLFKDGK